MKYQYHKYFFILIILQVQYRILHSTIYCGVIYYIIKLVPTTTIETHRFILTSKGFHIRRYCNSISYENPQLLASINLQAFNFDSLNLVYVYTKLKLSKLNARVLGQLCSNTTEQLSNQLMLHLIMHLPHTLEKFSDEYLRFSYLSLGFVAFTYFLNVSWSILQPQIYFDVDTTSWPWLYSYI